MPSTASDVPARRGGYHLEFAWNSPYGHVVRLLELLRSEGSLVLDLGCGNGPLAEVVAERAFHYVGCDVSRGPPGTTMTAGWNAIRSTSASMPRSPIDRLLAIAGGRRVNALLLLDVLEHLPETRAVLQALREAALRLGRPVLIVSVPNVVHFDVAAKLALGRWDVISTGLLDETQLQLFTEARLVRELRRFGWVQGLDQERHLTASLRAELAALRALVPELERDAREARLEADAMQNATLWKATGPLLLDLVRGRSQPDKR